MAFQLTIAAGKESGREFIFEQPSVLIGRTTECDVVLYDPGISRQHARIFHEDQQYFIEDMGSANGTRVNGEPLPPQERQQLADGDLLELGDIVFNFTTVVGPGDGDTDVVEQVGTRIVSRKAVARRGSAAQESSELLGDNLADEDAQTLRRRETRTLQALSKEALPAVREPPPRLSAAERARLRREATGFWDNARVAWIEAEPERRRAWVIASVVVMGLAAGLMTWALWQPDLERPKLPPEPQLLTRKPIRYSFGVGEHVDYERPDMKLFTFDLNSPVRAVAVLHYQAADISEGEVMISVNGAGVAVVPPDTLNAADLAHQVVVSFKHLKRGEQNEVLFDNTLFPPNRTTWRLWNVWMETLLVPELTQEQALTEAQSLFQRAQLNFDRAGIGARNLYDAWRDFRLTWITLEALPDPKPELYRLAHDKERAALTALDQLCNRLMLEAIGHFNQKNEEAAIYTLEHVHDYFPSYDHPCAFRAESKRIELGL